MDLELAGQVAVVIGAAQGIGRAIAAAFASEGASVAVADVAPAVQQVAAELGRQFDARTLPVVGDATSFDAMQQLAARVVTTLGRCDHIVFAAGTGSGKYGCPFWHLAPSDWDHVTRVNLFGAVNVAHAWAPYFAASRRGSWLFLASVAGQIGSPTDPPYSAAKAALINFMQCAAKDLAPFGVRVNAISPGMVQTNLNRSVWQAWNARQPESLQQSYEQWAEDKIRRVAPLRRWQTPEEIASLAVFLASRHAASITGQTLNVDGGQVMHA